MEQMGCTGFVGVFLGVVIGILTIGLVGAPWWMAIFVLPIAIVLCVGVLAYAQENGPYQ